MDARRYRTRPLGPEGIAVLSLAFHVLEHFWESVYAFANTGSGKSPHNLVVEGTKEILYHGARPEQVSEIP